MNRRIFGCGGLALVTALFATRAGAEPPKQHRVAFQVDTDDRRAQALVLGNVHNYAAYYKRKSEPFTIEIVAFGPGFSMVRNDMSMMKGELEDLQKELGASLTISACQNTRRAIAESEGKQPADIPLVAGVEETPSGVVRLSELQEKGWAYIRP